MRISMVSLENHRYQASYSFRVGPALIDWG